MQNMKHLKGRSLVIFLVVYSSHNLPSDSLGANIIFRLCKRITKYWQLSVFPTQEMIQHLNVPPQPTLQNTAKMLSFIHRLSIQEKNKTKHTDHFQEDIYFVCALKYIYKYEITAKIVT